MKQHILLAALVAAVTAMPLFSQDWPIYKGNIYFTGNNDEIIVKNANLKWLYQASDRCFNPVVSDGGVYFLDQKDLVYCLDEEYGRLRWNVDMKIVASQFKAASKSAGKVKYPLISGNSLFLSDPIAIYAMDKRDGRVQWARTGMRVEDTPAAASGLSGRKPLPQVDGIYADPVISGDAIYYGTRNIFLSRDIRNGHDKWENRAVKTWSAYPTFYDDSIITQSMDMTAAKYEVLRLDASTGTVRWSKQLSKPQRIFPPVVCGKCVYIPVTTGLVCLDYSTGEMLWQKDYGRYITSNPAFTDRAILFCLDNSDIAQVSLSDGSVIATVPFGEKSGPLFVTVRDMLYAAYNVKADVGGKAVPYGHVKAVSIGDAKTAWEFTAPFPGVVSQPIASKGSLIFPAGNYVYAIGTEYYPKTVQGGEGFAKLPDDGKPSVKPDAGADKAQPQKEKNPVKKTPEMPLRPLDVAIMDQNGAPVSGTVEVRKWDKGKIVYDKTVPLDKKGTVMVPEGDGVEITALGDGYLPGKKPVAPADQKIELKLEKIRKDIPYIVDAITFEYDKAYLRRESLNVLDNVVKTMKQNGSMKLEVSGHTDSTGDPSYNIKLSERRADAVIEYMVKNGISPERLSAKGFGSSKPVAPNDTDANRAKNRRTEFIFR